VSEAKETLRYSTIASNLRAVCSKGNVYSRSGEMHLPTKIGEFLRVVTLAVTTDIERAKKRRHFHGDALGKVVAFPSCR
jgi:hypothetical protein